MPRARSARLPLAVVFFIALTLRLVHIWQIRRSPFFDVLLGDARGYDEWARRIAAGEWIGRDVFYQAPLYPYFLGVIYTVIGHSLLAVRIVQAVLGSASCLLLALAGRRFFSARTGLAAGVGLAIYAPAIFFDGLLQKSVLDVFFLTVSIWLVARLVDDRNNRRVWLGLGAAMGALSLTRENALAFVAVLLAWSLIPNEERPAPAPTGKTRASSKKAPASEPRRRSSGLVARLPAGAMFVAGLAVVLLPVAARNYAVGGGFYLTTSQFGPNFFIGNNAGADGTYMSLRFGRGAPEYERQDATELAEHATGRTMTPGDVSSYWTGRALDFITAHPGSWLRLMARKLLLLLNAREMLDTESQESYAEWSWPLRIGGWFGNFGVLVPLALLGMLVAWREKRTGILYALTGTYAASVLMFYVFARYRLPLVPLFMLFAADGVAWFLDWLASAKQPDTDAPGSGIHLTPKIAVAALAVLGCAVVANWPLLSGPLMIAITETNLAVQLQADGRATDAAAHYERAIAIQPDYAPAYNNLGVARRAAGDLPGALAALRQAVSLRPDYPDAHYNLANALLSANQPEEAARHFRIALQSIPDSAGVSNNLGIALAAEGRAGDAVAAFRQAVAVDPTSAKAHRNLADALASAGHTAEAVAEFERARTLDPNDPATRYNFGSTLLEAGRLEEAVAEFRAAVRLTPESPEAHNNLGIALGSLGDVDGAIEEFRRALALRPGFADAERNLATARAQRAPGGGRP